MSDLHVVILAAGQGKRMHSTLPKVLHPVLFRPMLHHVLDLATSLSPKSLTVVVGHGEDQVRASCSAYQDLQFVRQADQKGTGHAVQQVAPLLEKESGRVLVLCGDVVALARNTLESLTSQSADAAVLTAWLNTPTGYGRILRDGQNRLRAIREEADCSEVERGVQEVNTGVYVFSLPALFSSLKNLGNRNRQSEYYLTDVMEILVREGKKVEAIRMFDAREMIGINDRVQLTEVQAFLRDRTNEAFMRAGVTLQDSFSTWLDPRCQIASDVSIEGGCQIVATQIGSGVTIESGCRLIDSEIAENTHIKQGSVLENARVGEHCSIGPYAHLRPGSALAQNVKIGNFVELKKTTFASGAKANHLSYIGDAEIGADVNLGCGFVTCNYDGKAKHKTIIEDGVFVGSDSQCVAPVRVGKGSYIAAGSTVTEDVPKDSLVLTRGRQVTKPGYAKKYPKRAD